MKIKITQTSTGQTSISSYSVASRMLVTAPFKLFLLKRRGYVHFNDLKLEAIDEK